MTDSKVLVLPGLPRNLTKPAGEQALYPDTTIDMVKVLREYGLESEFVDQDERTLVSHKAFDVWLPILEFTSNLATGVAGGLLANLIQSFFVGTDTSQVIHISWRVRHRDGTLSEFNYDGPVNGAIQSAEIFGQALRPSDGNATD
ncbi:hypothetical protein [Arthrobacter sp. H14-L1]|uniref:hypothetical protein n=1 Tax=Arthrobacter sp. H14-L1 TaxID=2996697 RepID=UPI002271DFA4|nr:hypothetical protein [Arthrobacter sp. H14-L1]MCY0903613.1 hypothetical protein [Arthrobacter sp. H14-L1]